MNILLKGLVAVTCLAVIAWIGTDFLDRHRQHEERERVQRAAMAEQARLAAEERVARREQDCRSSSSALLGALRRGENETAKDRLLTEVRDCVSDGVLTERQAGVTNLFN